MAFKTLTQIVGSVKGGVTAGLQGVAGVIQL